MVAAFRPVPHYAPFPNSSTQPQVIRNKRLTTNLLDTIRLGYARLTSGMGVNRLLDPKSDITLASLQCAAAMVGRRVLIELV
jgi:hypothetical protein